MKAQRFTNQQQFDWGPFLTLLLLCMRRQVTRAREWGSTGTRCRSPRMPRGCVLAVHYSSH